MRMQIHVSVLKAAVSVFGSMLFCGCHFSEGTLRHETSEQKTDAAIVSAYKNIWHSFYDEGNFERMLAVRTEGTRLCLLQEIGKSVLRDRITLKINEAAYSEWKAKANKMLEDAGASAFAVKDLRDGGRAICGRAYKFPVEVEASLAKFDWIVDAKRLERFVVKAALFDENDILVASITVPDFKFYMRGGGWCSHPFNFPFHHLSRVQDLFALYGEREIGEIDSCSDIEHGDVDFFDDRYLSFRFEPEIKKDYDPRSYVSVSDESGIVASNIISNMVQVVGENFLACKYEVTQKEWSALMGSNPSCSKGERNPVENITWHEARLFVDVVNSLPETQKAGLRFFLPSSEEWAYACYGNHDSEAQYIASKTGLDAKGWFEFNSNGMSHEVGLKKPNAFGLHDMLGNVFEYVCDTRDCSSYVSRVLCGGSYESCVDWMDETNECLPEDKFDYVGLRLFAVKVP